jgi:hypothetical protein
VAVWPAIVSVPVRGLVVVLLATEYDTVPLPLPLPPPVIVSHASLAVAVQAHPAGVVTPVVSAPPAAGAFCEVVDSAKLQPLACVTLTVWPATVRAPVRDGPVLAATLNAAVPLPVPLPVVTVIQLVLVVAVQLQPAAVVTDDDNDAAAAPGVCDVGDTVNVHPDACVTFTVCPAMMSEPLRDAPVLAATLNAAVPLPVPLPVVTVIQLVLVVAVQVHPAAVVTDDDNEAAAAPGVCDVGETVKVHPAAWVTLTV